MTMLQMKQHCAEKNKVFKEMRTSPNATFTTPEAITVLGVVVYPEALSSPVYCVMSIAKIMQSKLVYESNNAAQ